MFKKTKKEKLSFLSVTEFKGATAFYCLIEKDGQDLFLMEKNGLKLKEVCRVDVFSEKGKSESLKGCSDFRFFHSGSHWYLVYSREYSRFFLKRKQTVVSKSSDMLSFNVIDREDGWEIEAFTSVFNHSHKSNFLAYFGGDSIRVGASKDLRNWHFSRNLISPRMGFFDDEPLHVLDAIVVKRGIVVIYEPKKNKKSQNIKLGAAIFSTDQPYKLIWRSSESIFKKRLGKENLHLKYIGCLAGKETITAFWVNRKNRIISEKLNLGASGVGSLKKRNIHLERHYSNPIISPKADNYWEYDSTFNPAAIHLEDKIHLIYRAIGANGVSVFGYASSNDGFAINERLNAPAFAAINFENYSKEDQTLYPSKYVSGGSWIGCEDPRMTKIGDRIYMTYTSFDGWAPPGVALTWISVKDFLKKNWTWKKPKLISKPGQIQKNWMLFPEKINGKYAILHSITPQIAIEYVDNIEENDFYIESEKKPGKDEHRWDNHVRGAGAPPIKTDYGWLVLYHAMDKRDSNRYKVGAMILDYDDPTKILFRSSCPILEPDMYYENEGAKAGVVYVCGALIKDDTLFVYYGGADSVICVATADVNAFLKDLSCDVANDQIVSRKAREEKIKKSDKKTEKGKIKKTKSKLRLKKASIKNKK